MWEAVFLRGVDMDKIELLKQYKELLDSGILTQEEFDAKKKQVLESPDEVTSSGSSGGLDSLLKSAKEKSEQAKEKANEKLEELRKKQAEEQEKRKAAEEERKKAKLEHMQKVAEQKLREIAMRELAEREAICKKEVLAAIEKLAISSGSWFEVAKTLHKAGVLQ